MENVIKSVSEKQPASQSEYLNFFREYRDLIAAELNGEPQRYILEEIDKIIDYYEKGEGSTLSDLAQSIKNLKDSMRRLYFLCSDTDSVKN